MVKKKVGGSHRYKALAQASKATEEQAGPKPPQHLQRKITKKVKFFEKVAQSSTAAALQVERGVKKKQRKAKAKQLPNLQSLAGELEQLSQLQGEQQEKQRPGKGIRSSIKRSKARLAITLTETQRLQAVLQHPLYKADPIQAITNHLTTTMPAVPKQQKQQQQGAKSKRSKRKGGGGGVAGMQS